MSSDEKTLNLKMDVKPGLNLGRVFVPYGKTVTVPRSRAESLLKSKKCSEYSGDAEIDFPTPYAPQSAEQKKKSAEKFIESLQTEASELTAWPAYMQLNKGGLTTVESLKAFVAASPKDWDAKLQLTAEDKAAVEAELKKLEKPKAKPAAKE